MPRVNGELRQAGDGLRSQRQLFPSRGRLRYTKARLRPKSITETDKREALTSRLEGGKKKKKAKDELVLSTSDRTEMFL